MPIVIQNPTTGSDNTFSEAGNYIAQNVNVNGSVNSLIVNADGSINVSGINISIGSLALSLEEIYITSGTMYQASGNVYVQSGNNLLGSMAILGVGGIGPLDIDNSTHHIIAITQEHHEIHDGRSFVASISGAGGNGTEISIGFTTANGSRWVHAIHSATSSVEANFKIWESPTISGDNILTPINRNRNVGIASESILLNIPTISGTSPTSGTKMVEEHFGDGKTGGESRATLQEFILKSGTDYLYTLTSEAASADLSLELNWYEHSDKTQQF